MVQMRIKRIFSLMFLTFTENGTSTDSIIYSYVEDFVAKFDFSDDQFAKVTFSEHSEILKLLKGDSSPGEDGVHNRFLKKLSSKGMDLLLKIVNMSHIEGLPSTWKAATITMIPKKDIKSTNYADYRPISLLSCAGKVAEHVVKNILYDFLENSILIIKEQSGFRNKRGTTDNLLFMTQKIQECLNRKKKVCGIFFDISKAFNKVWHASLIYKLIYLGVPAYIIRFIRNFLSDRFLKKKAYLATLVEWLFKWRLKMNASKCC